MSHAPLQGSDPAPANDCAAVIRHAVASLDELDADTSDHLNALAFVMMRVARADGTLSADERGRMEDILVRDAGISAEHAVLVTEIARHRAAMADCGRSYGISRCLRTGLDRRRRRSIARLLTAIADADGYSCALERREIDQIASELGISAE
jgi:uncharacterized tellurite resistance protein B-like protein